MSLAPFNVLEQYVYAPDATLAWTVVSRSYTPRYSVFILELTSQTWLSNGAVDKPVWKHWLTVVIPANKVSDICILWVVGGNSDSPQPAAASTWAIHAAIESGMPVAELAQVPNQPLSFNDHIPRSEDDLIAFLQSQYGAGDRTALARLPMVKSVTAAMTAIQEWSNAEVRARPAIRSFILSGASKRGWTAWLAALLDPRVLGVAPSVINILNTNASIKHQWESIGQFSPALAPYVKHKVIPEQIGTRRQDDINSIEDPFSYLAYPKMLIPKYIVNAVGDDYFMPDSTRFAYPMLPGQKWLRMVPNCQHSLEYSDAYASIIGWCEAIACGHELPTLSWETRGGTLVARTSVRPKQGLLWRAANAHARDFRFGSIGAAFSSVVVNSNDNGEYVADISAPGGGYKASFMEFEYELSSRKPFKITTEVYISPDHLPFAWRF